MRAEPGASIGWERRQHQRLAGHGARGPRVCCPHPRGCKRTWGAHEELQKSALGKLSELTAEHEGATKLKESGRCFWGDFFLCSLPPRTQRSPRKPGRGKHFATWLLHAPAKETILQLKEEILGPGYFQPLLFVTQLAAFRAERRDCATLHVLFRPFNFSIARRIRGIEKSPVLRKEETCDSDT